LRICTKKKRNCIARLPMTKDNIVHRHFCKFFRRRLT
jgi:hypothetical protein